MRKPPEKVLRGERHVQTVPMSETHREAFHSLAAAKDGVHAKAEKVSGILMVKSLVEPYYSVPYEQFKEELAQRHAPRGDIIDK